LEKTEHKPPELIITKQKSEPSYIEFVILMSLMMSLTALSIDAMLPALPQIGRDLNVVNPNSRQLVISPWPVILWTTF
jgi:DHA1 family bicyclomycin/chloramphenicol resistance-like MFS transporter